MRRSRPSRERPDLDRCTCHHDDNEAAICAHCLIREKARCAGGGGGALWHKGLFVPASIPQYICLQPIYLVVMLGRRCAQQQALSSRSRPALGPHRLGSFQLRRYQLRLPRDRTGHCYVGWQFGETRAAATESRNKQSIQPANHDEQVARQRSRRAEVKSEIGMYPIMSDPVGGRVSLQPRWRIGWKVVQR